MLAWKRGFGDSKTACLVALIQGRSQVKLISVAEVAVTYEILSVKLPIMTVAHRTFNFCQNYSLC
jgi:hypothetical protein